MAIECYTYQWQAYFHVAIKYVPPLGDTIRWYLKITVLSKKVDNIPFKTNFKTILLKKILRIKNKILKYGSNGVIAVALGSQVNSMDGDQRWN